MGFVKSKLRRLSSNVDKDGRLCLHILFNAWSPAYDPLRPISANFDVMSLHRGKSCMISMVYSGLCGSGTACPALLHSLQQ